MTPQTRDKPSGEKGWTICGSIRSRVTLDALNIHFGEQPIYGQRPAIRKVVATAHVPVRTIEAEWMPAIGTVRIRPEPDGERFSLELWPSPDLPTGPFDAKLIVTTVEPNGERKRSAVLPIAGSIQPAVRILPATVLLGTHTVGENAEGVVVLQVPEGTDFRVVQVETSSNDVRAESIEVPEVPSGRAYKLTARVTSAGDHFAEITFVVRRGQNSNERLKTTLNYHGRAAK